MPSPLNQEYTAAFRAEMERLNPAQRAAVEQVDGPVMVLAGPGTGKTHLLAARIGNILLETDAGAHNILCLTFTEAGVKAMRDRLLSFIGPEAYRVGIYTFHGFCSAVIQDNLQYFGRPGLEPLGELERIEIIRALLDELPHDSPLRLGQEPYFYEGHLQHLFAAMKAENWEVDYLQQKIASYLAALPEHPDFTYQVNRGKTRKGDPKTGQIVEETRRMERLAAAVQLFPAYQERLRETRRYDYGDMIGWVLRAFNDYPSLLLSYQERYQYVLVDEFQDTNGSQDAIIRQLTAYWERPNIFIVGDDDQSIYEFQGARLRSMVDFFRRHDEVKVVTLTENYRSQQAILDAAGAVIGENQRRIGREIDELDIDKRLVSAGQFRATTGSSSADTALRSLAGSSAERGAARSFSSEPRSADEQPKLRNGSSADELPRGGDVLSRGADELRRGADVPTVLHFPDPRQETGALLHQLRAWHAAGTPWREMAVIYATHAQATHLRHLLERAGIPYRSKRRPNVLDSRPVRQLRELLAYLQLEHDRPGTGEHLIYRILQFRNFETQPQDLARLNLARRELRSTTGSRQLLSWRDYLQRPDDWPTDLKDAEAIQLAADFLEATVGKVHSLPLAELVEDVTSSSRVLAQTVAHPDRRELLQQLATFTDFVLSEVARRPRLTLGGLLDTLRQMDANRVELPLRNHLDQVEAVLLVTAHSAKGLEFDRVWMLDVTEKTWGTGGRSSGRRQFKLPDTLTYSGTEDEEEARRRLFFVALTRARHEVILSYADIDPRGRVITPAPYVSELLAATGLEPETRTLDADTVTELAALQLQPNDPARLADLEEAAITDLLADYRLSISGLYAYLDCPLRFYYEKLLRVPDQERDRVLVGTAMHQALEDYFNRMLKSPERAFPSKEELLYYYDLAIGRMRGRFTPAFFDRYLNGGKRELATYFDRKRPRWINNVRTEFRISNAEVDGVPLTGSIDRVDFTSDAFARVVDYKTGTSRDKSRFRPPSASRPNGGHYWRQLTFYKLLFDNRPGTIHRIDRGTISYIVRNSNGEQLDHTLELTRKDTDALRKIIREAWEAIQERQFTGCGEADCEWCRFVADRRAGAPSGDDARELLDDGT